MKGLKQTIESIIKRTRKCKGKNHYNWQGGITAKKKKIREGLKIRVWRKKVFERDNYTCQECSACSGKGSHVVLNAHHILPFAYFSKYRFDVSNGITWCKKCHKKYHDKIRSFLASNQW
jgi:5-methylcytosine-specific restriction endonuclease McrA